MNRVGLILITLNISGEKFREHLKRKIMLLRFLKKSRDKQDRGLMKSIPRISIEKMFRTLSNCSMIPVVPFALKRQQLLR